MRTMGMALGVVLCFASVGWSQEEFGGGRGRRGGDMGGMFRLHPLMTALDTDNDGEISSAELAAAVASLKKLDKNNDGKLSADELRPAFPAGGPGGPGGFAGPGGFPGRGERERGGGGGETTELVNRLFEGDKNNDGKLSADELPQRMRALFERADADRDGFLSRAEVTRMVGSQAGGGERGGPGGEGRRGGEGRPGEPRPGEGRPGEGRSGEGRPGARPEGERRPPERDPNA